MQQPIPYDQLPTYLVFSPKPHLKPPKLWCGWRLTEEELVAAAVRHVPDGVIYEQPWNRPDLFLSIQYGGLLQKIREHCQVPKEDMNLLDVNYAVRPGGGGRPRETDLVLSVGSTREGVMNECAIGSIGRFLAVDGDPKPPEWHLSPHNWRWVALRE